jgi:ATP-dependent DNA helicase RecG
LSFSEILSLGAEYVLVPVDIMHTSIDAGELAGEFWRWFLDRRRERGLRDVKGLKEKLGVVKRIGDKKFLTLAGLLFFHKDPQETMPHTYIRIRWGDRWVRIGGPIWMQVDKVIDMLMDILPRRVFIKGVRRVETPIIPIEILREAIVNAVVHRNYSIFSEVFVDVSSDGVRISNPGSFPPGTTPENPIPIPRNPILYELMFQVGYVERQGGGIEMMRELCSEYGIKMYYDISPYYTRLTFKAPYEEFLDELERDIISLLREPKSSSELASILGRSKPTIVRKLKSLEKRGIIKSVGRGPRTKWVLT